MKNERLIRLKTRRKRQVKTTLEKYGKDHYAELGKKVATYKDRKKATLSSWKYWHVERFDDEGNLLPEWQEKLEKLDVSTN